MSGIATAIVGAAVVGGVASNMAANTQAKGQEQAANTQAGMFNTIVGQEQPFMQAGQTATTQLSGMLQPGGYLNNQNFTPFSFNPSSITSSPGYQFSQQQGLQQTQNALAPNVGALSGPTLQALTNYSTGNAEQYYNNYYNQALGQYSTNFNTQQTQQNNIFSRLSAIAGLGQNAASNTGTAGTSLGTGIAQAQAAAAGSQAAGIVGVGNAAGSAANGFALSSILSNNGGGGGGTPDPFAGTAQGANGMAGTLSAGS